MFHHHALLILGTIILVASCVVVFLIANAPEGHETERGFHRDSPEALPKGEQKNPEMAASVASEPIKTA